MTASFRQAGVADAALVLDFIFELADYEKLSHEVVATTSDLEAALGGASPRVFCEIVEWEGKSAGFSLWFYTFSTFQGQHGIWLEDLYVRPEFRGKGLGKALIQRLAARCSAEGLGRLEWWVLDWNTPSIDFYKSLGAQLQDEWTKCRIDGTALEALAKS